MNFKLVKERVIKRVAVVDAG